MYGKKPSLAYLRVFGCDAWFNIPKQLRRKGQKKARKLIFIGHESAAKS